MKTSIRQVNVTSSGRGLSKLVWVQAVVRIINDRSLEESRPGRNPHQGLCRRLPKSTHQGRS